VTTLQQVEPGKSGAISALGTAGGITGATLVAVCGLPWLPAGRTAGGVLLVITAGTLGSLVDSFLGATFQSQYRCSVCMRVTERRSHCSQSGTLVHGCCWITNDAVNLLCTASAGLYSWILSRSLF
jgi:uncharacterized membrane protein